MNIQIKCKKLSKFVFGRAKSSSVYQLELLNMSKLQKYLVLRFEKQLICLRECMHCRKIHRSLQLFLFKNLMRFDAFDNGQSDHSSFIIHRVKLNTYKSIYVKLTPSNISFENIESSFLFVLLQIVRRISSNLIGIFYSFLLI